MLAVDYTRCPIEPTGTHRLAEAISVAAAEGVADPVKFLLENPYGWPTGWYNLPETRPELERIKEYAAEINIKANDLLLLGIGGSALGNIALRSSLNPPRANEIAGNLSVHVLDNVDPRVSKAVLDRLDPARTYVNVITKSGGTLETMASFFVTLDCFSRKLSPDEIARRFICTTDPESSLLKDIATERVFRRLSIPRDVGGRLSILSSVGLLSAAATGVDIDALLDGALDMRNACVSSDPNENPALNLALALYNFGAIKKRPMVVMMPYSDGLSLWADWWRQLWAESLGKKHAMDGSTLDAPAGTTPIKALGSTDQHSQVQLYQEGPDDKAFIFLRVESWEESPGIIRIPETARAKFGYLDDTPFDAIIDAECEATMSALSDAGRPVIEIRFPQVDASHVGQFIMLWELATAYAGILWNVNPFDQPGVEAGKIAAKNLLAK
ncbi:glucose-6-phosphate isomerase [bacterium]|nr:glucose-6-phosphate isomerase [bacterium]